MADSDLKKLLLCHPRICEYSLENYLQPHVHFLRSLGISQDKLRPVSLPPLLPHPALPFSCKIAPAFSLAAEIFLVKSQAPRLFLEVDKHQFLGVQHHSSSVEREEDRGTFHGARHGHYVMSVVKRYHHAPCLKTHKGRWQMGCVAGGGQAPRRPNKRHLLKPKLLSGKFCSRGG